MPGCAALGHRTDTADTIRAVFRSPLTPTTGEPTLTIEDWDAAPGAVHSCRPDRAAAGTLQAGPFRAGALELRRIRIRNKQPPQGYRSAPAADGTNRWNAERQFLQPAVIPDEIHRNSKGCRRASTRPAKPWHTHQNRCGAEDQASGGINSRHRTWRSKAPETWRRWAARRAGPAAELGLSAGSPPRTRPVWHLPGRGRMLSFRALGGASGGLFGLTAGLAGATAASGQAGRQWAATADCGTDGSPTHS